MSAGADEGLVMPGDGSRPVHRRDGVLGVVLAGGAGSRVGGADKGLLPLGRRPLVEHVLERLRPQCDRLLIIANRNTDEYARYAPVVHDRNDGHAGPLAGLVAAFGFLEANRHALPHWVLTAPVDCPDLPRELAGRLRAALAADAMACCAFVHHAGAAQPLFAMYRIDADAASWRTAAEHALHAHGSARLWHQSMDAVAVACDDAAGAFHNLNSLEAFREYASTHD
ncbi:MAG TPA: molybdenum cofactor guanylyltransferase MobA [Rhodanobacteraceae bacterium]|jgi:molybdenum cofactor guanylyltransferase|nr:molybdenum cofactor guanylyltransferase MobA [Rhodanobacteraceae bacterium]